MKRTHALSPDVPGTAERAAGRGASAGLNVVLLSTSDIGHGAGVAAFRLHRALRGAGIGSHMLVSERCSDDPAVVELLRPPRGRLARAARHFEHRLEKAMNSLGPQCVYSVASRGIAGHPLVRDADVVHLHNIHWTGRNLSLLLLRLGKPLVWTLHDMWPLTGHCFYPPAGCDRWTSGCGRCPDLDIFPRLLYDSTALQFRLKRYLYRRARPVVVAPSRWMEQAARASPLFCGCEVRRIPNGVDRNEFRPVGHLEARAALGIDPASRCVLWAASSLGDPRKGFLQFEETMLRLRQRSGPEAVTVLLVGRGDPSRSTLAQAFPVRHFGHVDDTLRLSTIFSAADIFVSTSVQDNLPNVILEVLACGTPVAGFDAGGVPDMVKNNENGCLVAVNDCAALAGRIGAMLGDPGRLKAMRRKAVDIIAREFSSELQARRCADLYREIRGTAGGRP